MNTTERIVWLRSLGIGSPEIARRLGIPRAEVNRVMRQQARKERRCAEKHGNGN